MLDMWLVLAFALTIIRVNNILAIPMALLIISWGFCILFFIAKLIGSFCGELIKEEVVTAIQENKKEKDELNEKLKEQQYYVEELERKLMLNNIQFDKKNFG